MSLRMKSVWLSCLAGVGCVAVAFMAATALASGASGRVAAAAKCTTTNTEVWLGDGEGGGVLGGIYYPLEFSNVGHHSCTLTGYPGVSGFAGTRQTGPAASRFSERHGTVTLKPGATAHAILKIEDWGALCSHEVLADGLRVFAPGQTQSELIDFPFGACRHRSVLLVYPVRSGVGIPAYTIH